jgi:hypothetical protein
MRPQPHGGALCTGGALRRRRMPRGLDYLAAMRYAWRDYDRRPIYTWAGENVDIPAGVYTVSGFFDVSRSRYLLKPFDALQSDIVRKVTFQAPTRSGKSLLADIWLMWLISQSSGPTMWNFNTDPQARKHFRTRLLPLMLATRCIADLLPEDTRKLTQEVIFRDGVPLYVQGPALDNLQGVGVCNLIEDELWRRDEGRHAQALSRLGDYEKLGMDKNLNIGQGGYEGDDQDLEFQAGTQEEWFVPCEKCGHRQEPIFSGSRGDGSLFGMRFGDKPECKDRYGDWVISKVIPTVRWECEKCGHPHVDEERTKKRWNDEGDYVVKNPDARRIAAEGLRLEDFIDRSFHIPGLLTKSWIDQVIKYCKAQNQLRMGNLDPLITIVQKDQARSWSEAKFLNAKPTPTYDLSKAWPDAKYRFITIDVQELGEKWLLICDWSPHGECRPIWYGKVFGETEILAKQKEFKIANPRHVFIDCGHDAKGTTGVYAMCIRNGWTALRGDDRPDWLHSEIVKTPRGPQKITIRRSYSEAQSGDAESGRIGQGHQFALVFYWSNPTIKRRFHKALDRGKVKFPVGPNGEEIPWVKELKRQIAKEYRKRIYNRQTGRFKEIWFSAGENEGFDCMCEQFTAATMARILKDDPSDEEQEDAVAPVTPVLQQEAA